MRHLLVSVALFCISCKVVDDDLFIYEQHMNNVNVFMILVGDSTLHDYILYDNGVCYKVSVDLVIHKGLQVFFDDCLWFKDSNRLLILNEPYPLFGSVKEVEIIQSAILGRVPYFYLSISKSLYNSLGHLNEMIDTLKIISNRIYYDEREKKKYFVIYY